MTAYTSLKIYADWKCWPLWPVMADGGVENPDPRELGLPGDLAARLLAWSDDYDEAIDEDDFTAPLFDDPEQTRAFGERGLDLAREVAAAVGERYGRVTYTYPDDGRTVDVG